MKNDYDCVLALARLGFTDSDAYALRRIAMTLHRWHELECGDGNDYGSWTITRGRKETRHGEHAGGHGAHYVFVHDDDGAPFLEHHHYRHGKGEDSTSYSLIPDREKDARKRLAAIMARYPTFSAYVQTDPRGASLYILRPGDVPEGADVSCYYSRGVAVHK
jgi:hypothetical protein